MTLSTWLALFAACWAISISPGAGAISAMSSGLQHGFVRGYWTTLGLILGIWCQVAIVALGLGTLLATSETGFLIVKWLGVAYLVYLGIQQLRATGAPVTVRNAPDAKASTRRALVTNGWLVNITNPKGTVFLLAVVPQFINPAMPLAQQYAIIGATLGFTDLVIMGLYTALAARVLRLLRSPAHIRGMNIVFGTLFLAAGAWLATFRRG